MRYTFWIESEDGTRIYSTRTFDSREDAIGNAGWALRYMGEDLKWGAEEVK